MPVRRTAAPPTNERLGLHETAAVVLIQLLSVIDSHVLCSPNESANYVHLHLSGITDNESIVINKI